MMDFLKTTTTQQDGDYLNGQLLIAMPDMPDPRFEKAIIYICSHSDEGAMGLILNKLSTSISFKDLLSQLDIVSQDQPIYLPETSNHMRVHAGGPVETGRGFVLHSRDFHLKDATLPINSDISLTATLEILRAIVNGKGPSQAILALGYAGWSAGQLENEIQANGWLHCDPSNELIFSTDLDNKYDMALAQLGIDAATFSTVSGTA